jgi:hypothetical protein
MKPGQPAGCASAALAEVVAMVSVVVAAVPPVGVTVAGEKLQVAPVGRPEQAKLTAALNPPEGWIETVVVVELPLVTVALLGDRLIEKPGAAGAETVTVTAAEVDALKLVSPPYCAVIVSAPTGSAVVLSVATPLLFSVPVPRLVVPLRNVTVPVGTVVFPLGPVTVAVKVMLSPVVAVVADAASVVVEAAGVAAAVVTVTLTALDVDAL